MLPWLIMMLGLAITYHVWDITDQFNRKEAQFIFSQKTTDIVTHIKERMLSQEQLLLSTRGLFNASHEVSREEFRTFIDSLQLTEHFPGLQGIGFAKAILPTDKPHHIAAIRQQGFPDYTIRPEGQRELYTSIIYLEPFNARNQRAFGFDMFSETVRRQAMSSARDVGGMALSSKVTLVQENEQQVQPGFLMYLSVYRNKLPHDTLEQRRANLIGWVYSPFRAYDLIRATLQDVDPSLQIRIFDGDSANDDALLYASQADQPVDNANDALNSQTLLAIHGHHWLISITADTHGTDGLVSKTALVLIFGTLLSAMLGLLSWFLLNGRQRALRYAERINRELSISENRFRNMANTAPVLIWMANTEQVCFWFNQVWLDFTGRNLTQEQGNGWQENIHPADFESYFNTFASHFKQRSAFHLIYRLRRHDGEYRWLDDHGVPLFDEQGHFSGYIGSCTDITERKINEDQIQATSHYARSLIEASLDPLVTISPDGIITDVNHATEQVTGVERTQLIGSDFCQYFTEPALASAGYREVFTRGFVTDYPLAIRHRCGTITDELYNASLYRNQQGEVIGVFAAARDITQRKKLDAKLSESLKLFHAVFNNATIGIAQLSTTGQFLQINEEFCQLIGYSREEVLSQKLTFQQITHPDDLLDDLRQVQAMFESKNRFSKEKRYIRKDGLNVWVHVSVNVVRNNQGKPDYVIAAAIDISQKKRFEQQLKNSEEKFSKIFHSSPFGIAITMPDNGTFIDVNPAFLDIYGYSRTEVIGRSSIDLAMWMAPAERVRLMNKLLQERSLKELEVKFRHKTGKAGVVLLSMETINIGSETFALSLITDITARKQAEETIQSLLNEQRAIVNSTLAGIFKTRQRRFIWSNATCQQQLGYSAEQLTDLPTRALYPDETAYQAFGDFAYPLIKDGNTVRSEIQFLCNNGTLRWFAISGCQLSPDTDEAIWALLDIEDKKRYEAELIKARASSEAIAKAKSAFLANMSHEIRTPMNGVIGLTQLALNQNTSPQVHDYLEKIARSSQSLLNILNDILDLSKLEAGHINIEQRTFNLDTLLENLSAQFGAQAQAKQLNFQLRISDNSPREVIGDTLRLQQVLANLLSNAIKFTQRGSITLDISCPSLSNSNPLFLFSVRDSGLGIAREDQAKLFKAFSQIDDTISRRFGGTGLGLAISQSLLNLMGTQLQVISSPGQGSTFSFELALPVASAAAAHAKPLGSSARPGTLSDKLAALGRNLLGARILVAEDNHINQQVVREFLQLSGILVTLADNGEEAIKRLAQQAFDAVLMDVHMPVLDGMAATRQIRAQPEYAQLPIIALTAGVTEDERENYLACGMNDFIAKPIVPETLFATLTRWIKCPARSDHRPTTPALPPRAPSTDLENPPGFDFSTPLLMLGNDRALLFSLLKDFVAESAETATSISRLVEAGDFNSAYQLVHKLKGTAGYLGAQNLQALAQTLESALKVKGTDPEALALLTTELRRIAAWLSEQWQTSEQDSDESATIETLESLAFELDSLLAGHDFIDHSLLQGFKTALPSRFWPQYETLHTQIKQLHYLQARETLKSLLSSISNPT